MPGVDQVLSSDDRLADVLSSDDRLADAEHVPLAVTEPVTAFTPCSLAGVVSLDLGDPVPRSRSGYVDLFEHHAAPSATRPTARARNSSSSHDVRGAARAEAEYGAGEGAPPGVTDGALLTTASAPRPPDPNGEVARRDRSHRPDQASSVSAGHEVTTRSAGTPHSSARAQPKICQSS